ncbi:MAG: glycosyltransferase [Candidatus Acidiferrales bacterium]
MRILMLRRECDGPWLGWPYESVLKHAGVEITHIPEEMPLDADIFQLLAICPERPSLIFRPECTHFPLPGGLTEVDIPTAIEEEDVYAYTQRRIGWSMLFDYPVIYHPGFASSFRAAGHPRPIELPQALKRELYARQESGREYEVGWVGKVDGPIYRARRPILLELARHFIMNDWQRQYSQAEMADVYLRSKIIVNISRDDFPRDANRRVFEAMGSGALLVTKMPTELTDIGLEEGVHFAGYRDMGELVPLVRKYLDNEQLRCRIAEAGREEVLRNHTYEARVEKLLSVLREDAGRLWAPARSWPAHRVDLAYLDYHAGNGPLARARREWPRVARKSVSGAVRGAALIAGAWSRRWR